MNGIKWLFFDVGSTLVDESEVYRQRFAAIAKSSGVNSEAVYEKAISYYSKGKKGDKETAAFYKTELPEWDSALEKLYTDAEECLAELSKRYKIGVIANQSLGTEHRLDAYGLMKYISLVVASAEEGVAKPDPKIFQTAFERSGCSPQECFMIGDRVDNDIMPAKTLGMGTVLVRQGFAAMQNINDITVQPDYIVSSLTEMMHIFSSKEET